MRVCASLSSASDMDAAMAADMVEVRLDLLGSVPDTRGKDTLVTFRDPVDLSVLPEGFSGMIDVGEQPRPATDLTVVGSYHDYDATPDADGIVSKLTAMDADIRKGAFRVNRLADLASILDASKAVDGRHVLLGMGALGAVTRIRADVLGNEFSFGYVGEPTAPGQFSVSEMLALGDGCTVLGILGNPLGKSRSPAMHTRSGFSARIAAQSRRSPASPRLLPRCRSATSATRSRGVSQGFSIWIARRRIRSFSARQRPHRQSSRSAASARLPAAASTRVRRISGKAAYQAQRTTISRHRANAPVSRKPYSIKASQTPQARCSPRRSGPLRARNAHTGLTAHSQNTTSAAAPAAGAVSGQPQAVSHRSSQTLRYRFPAR